MSLKGSGAAGLRLRSWSGSWFRFDPGALCLELLPTGGPGAFARWEVLHAPEDLVGWAAECRLRPVPRLTVSWNELRAARQLRDALWEMSLARAAGEPLPAEPLAVVNAAAARPPLTPLIAPDGTRALAEPATGRQLLATVAHDAIDLFTGPHAHRIRVCSSDTCSLVYVDTSRPGRRRWCAMEHCGNLHKVRAHRARHEAAGTHATEGTDGTDGTDHATGP
ncbi:CGNR zinc finger domain-containing protein [Streptomyces triticirhizae]|uniref:Zf-CGNR multi-domain protein n=1 Tax=Streptomyces triticirhizae TaxID=2483353 RepID=A0A3M2KTM1_9ACTN|nr:CGNR zinc finger domain-containing protein [Streptomyces triticirhizae]RMI28016.1 zf-CGNR multi-domain protein [Streptomyces triticirhizae]